MALTLVTGLGGDHSHRRLDMKLTDIQWPTNILLPSNCDHIVLKQRLRDNTGAAPNICTNSCNESSGRPVGNAVNC
jgi:hypothetical protein